MRLHYGGHKYDDLTYNDILVRARARTRAFSLSPATAPTRRWSRARLRRSRRTAAAACRPSSRGIWTRSAKNSRSAGIRALRHRDGHRRGGSAVFAGLDAAGEQQERRGVKADRPWAQRPFILKGIMTGPRRGKALEAGASGIVVSNHGGRVLDHCPATAEVLPDIVDAVGGKMTILVDGAIRSGMDMFKALCRCGRGAHRPPVCYRPSMAAGRRACSSTSSSKQSLPTRCVCAARTRSRTLDRSMLYGF